VEVNELFNVQEKVIPVHDYAIKCYAKKTYEEVEVQLHHSWPRRQMEVTGKSHHCRFTNEERAPGELQSRSGSYVKVKVNVKVKLSL
jgi:hypothetical protein